MSPAEAAFPGQNGKIAFASFRAGNYEIHSMNAKLTNLVNPDRLTNNPAFDYQPAWSPDGTKIAFSRGSEIYTMNAANGTGVVRLTNNPASIDMTPAWQRLSARPGSPPGINAPCNAGVAPPG